MYLKSKEICVLSYEFNWTEFKFPAKAPGARRSSTATADCFRRRVVS